MVPFPDRTSFLTCMHLAAAQWRGTLCIFGVPPLGGSLPSSALCYEQQPPWSLQTPVSCLLHSGTLLGSTQTALPCTIWSGNSPHNSAEAIRRLASSVCPLSWITVLPCLEKHCSILSFFVCIFVLFLLGVFFGGRWLVQVEGLIQSLFFHLGQQQKIY